MENQKTLFLLGLGIVGLGVLGSKAMADDSNFFRYDSLFKKYGRQYSVPWRWLKAIAIVESDLGNAPSVRRGLIQPNDIEGSKSSDGKSWGIMQVTLTTARELRPGTTVSELNNPEISVSLAAMYLSRLIKIFGINDKESVIRAYNGGPGFRNTLLGKTKTPVYFAKFQAALAKVLEEQPGNEMEIG
jgi:soluble lytic murein transglycosylase-like protein